jgi:hypothetical protein
VSLHARDAEDLGPDRFFPLAWCGYGVGGVQFELSFRDTTGHGERVPVATLVDLESSFP